jgi:hypothetical protein
MLVVLRGPKRWWALTARTRILDVAALAGEQIIRFR